MITIIAAAAENNALGKNNQMIWHLPDDFKRFKQLTTGHHIIMGRKTFDSLPKKLPNRTHIIITRQKNYFQEDCIIAKNLEEAISFCPENETAFVIGGGEIYKSAMPFADIIELTRVYENFEADTFFPEIDKNIWHLQQEIFHPKDKTHQYDFSFQTFVRK